MTTKLNMIRDMNGFNTFGLPFCDDKFSMQLSVGVAQSITVPGNFQKWLAIFFQDSGSNIWVSLNTTATYPTGSVSAATSEENPTARLVIAGDTLSFITPEDGTKCGVCLYAIP